MRVDYNFYVENFGGSQVPERAWFSLEMKAEKRLEHFGFGRTACDWSEKDWEQNAKYAICEMTEAMQKREATMDIPSAIRQNRQRKNLKAVCIRLQALI